MEGRVVTGLETLRITCASVDCNNPTDPTHYFKPKKEQPGPPGTCRGCGADLVGWERANAPQRPPPNRGLRGPSRRERRVNEALGGGGHPMKLFHRGLILDHPHHDLLGALPAL